MFKDFLKDIVWFVKSDVILKTETCWYGREEKVDGFYFYTKRPFSKSYQYHSAIGLESTYKILSLISGAIKKKKKAIHIQVSSGWGRENIYIWKGSLNKAEQQMRGMIKQIQKQY